MHVLTEAFMSSNPEMTQGIRVKLTMVPSELRALAASMIALAQERDSAKNGIGQKLTLGILDIEREEPHVEAPKIIVPSTGAVSEALMRAGLIK